MSHGSKSGGGAVYWPLDRRAFSSLVSAAEGPGMCTSPARLLLPCPFFAHTFYCCVIGDTPHSACLTVGSFDTKDASLSG